MTKAYLGAMTVVIAVCYRPPIAMTVVIGRRSNPIDPETRR